MNTSYELAVLVNGNPIKKFSHEGKHYIWGTPGTEYTIKVRNNTSRRILAIVSVDGINVVDGSEASSAGTGYVIGAWSSYEIKGFRESDDHVGKFKFTNKEGSYAKDVTGSAGNAGVIGLMVIKEKDKSYNGLLRQIDWMYRPEDTPWFTEPRIGTPVTPSWTCDSLPIGTSTTAADKSYNTKLTANATSQMVNYCQTDLPHAEPQYMLCANLTKSAEEKPRGFDLGSTWGQRVEDKVRSVEFERGNLVETISLYYASKESLIQMGVPVNEAKAVSFPDAFPKQFCKPPTGYTG